MSSKPILHNGFSLENGAIIKNRIERVFFTDIYSLSNEKYLYLFTNINLDEIVNPENKPEITIINVGDRKLIGVIIDEFSSQKASEIINNLTQLRGLDCVAGMSDLKSLLINDVINPLQNHEKYQKFKLSIPNGILLYGPPGCGKTFIVKKLAEELGYNFIELSPSSIATPYIHGAVGNIAKVFTMAKLKSPSIIFIDEIEGLIPRREELGGHADIKKEEINEFLLQLNNAGENKILVVGATNRPHMIDTAILRSGRMDKRVYVGPPDFKARQEMFQLCLTGRPYDKSINFKKLAEMTENYVSSDIELIVTESARIAVTGNHHLINESMIVTAINKFSPSISSAEIEYFDQFSHLIR